MIREQEYKSEQSKFKKKFLALQIIFKESASRQINK